MIAGGFALVAGDAITAVGTGDEAVGDGADTNSNESGPDAEGSDEESAHEAVDNPDTAAPTLELSVSPPESVATSEGRAEFLITVANCGEETRSVPIALEVGCVEDELETPSLAPGERTDAYASYTDLDSGALEWSVAVGTVCERGTLTVT
ncbi:hypothetical protein C491_12150 [Natronococcus amylolyticus DSM 10524]|uniref:DUF11 domain-containing protein n=1 Tax=Natronococcus amylolyticus DSM 10524 TaxID=1227497 RepID=L9X4X2_9EURY|nr:hypothetical protein [Natronococcus amylolyticus]ELY56755.1 hypothetical protein C491_12150 [Natronococcus amylolyticus DSM 10524]